MRRHGSIRPQRVNPGNHDVVNTIRDAVVSLVLLSLVRPGMAQELYIYPMWEQTDEQKEQDKLDCFRWAAETSGVDPFTAARDRSEKIKQASQQPTPKKGGGSLARREAQEQEARQQQQQVLTKAEAQAEYENKMALFNQPFIECLEQRGYSVR